MRPFPETSSAQRIDSSHFYREPSQQIFERGHSPAGDGRISPDISRVTCQHLEKGGLPLKMDKKFTKMDGI